MQMTDSLDKQRNLLLAVRMDQKLMFNAGREDVVIAIACHLDRRGFIYISHHESFMRRDTTS